MTEIAIIGAGMAGLTLAHHLKDTHHVTVFEKARGAGGRMSARYAEPYYFDHGAQYFTARSQPFKDFLAPFIAASTVAEWTPRVTTLAKDEAPYKRDWFEPHYVATPNMNGLCKALLEGITFHRAAEITPLGTRTEEGWSLTDKNGETYGPFDWVISTAPPVQTQNLLRGTAIETALADVKLTGNYTLMLGLEHAPELSWDAAVVKDSPLEWIAVGSSKPGREASSFSLVAQSSNAWAESHIDEDIPEMQTLLVKELEALTGIDCSNPAYLTTHRWRYAAVEQAASEPFYLDTENRLAACGDWCETGRVEAAFTSALQLSKQLAHLT